MHRLIIALVVGLMVTGCSVLDDLLVEEVERPPAAPMSENPPTLAVSQGNAVQLGTIFASCWPDAMGTLCRDYMPAADWFERGDFLSVSTGATIALEFVEGRHPDGVTLNVYDAFPPSEPVATLDLAPVSNGVTWGPLGLGTGDYYVMVFGWWEDFETGAGYDAAYVVAVRVE